MKLRVSYKVVIPITGFLFFFFFFPSVVSILNYSEMSTTLKHVNINSSSPISNCFHWNYAKREYGHACLKNESRVTKKYCDRLSLDWVDSESLHVKRSTVKANKTILQLKL